MGTFYSPNIVTNGLQICLDARNVRSYSGTGTSWNDISGNGRTFTWTSAPSWDSTGFFNTTGKVATGPASNTIGINNTTGYTIFTVFQTNTGTTNGLFKIFGSGLPSSSTRGIFCHPSWTVGTIYFDQGGCCDANQRITATLPGYNTWTVMALTSGVSNRNIYLQGDLSTTTSTTAANIELSSTVMQLNPSDEGYNWDGKLAYFSVYNRALTLAEYQQNFSALRDRFGL